MNILFIGDIVGKPGRQAIFLLISSLIKDYNIDVVIANGENSAGGFGITPKIASNLFSYGVDIITTGNHIWKNKEIFKIIDTDANIIRPLNYPETVPGRGYLIFSKSNLPQISVINLMGRINLAYIDCPFQSVDKLLCKLETKIIIVDFHSETTAEKVAMGWYLDGRVSAVVGTHTHIQTADERILSKGTGYITDTGMTGVRDSVIGMDKDKIIKHFLTRMPIKFEVAKGDLQLDGVVLSIDSETGKTLKIERVKKFQQVFQK